MGLRAHTLQRFAEALERAPDVVMRHVDQDLQRAAIEGARDARGNAPMALSILVNSIRNQRIGLAYHQIIAEAGHAAAVEFGRAPNRRQPPIEAIRRWIRIVGMVPRKARNERGLAFLIARKIGRDGIEAQPYMKPAQMSTIERLRTLMPRAIERGLQEALA